MTTPLPPPVPARPHELCGRLTAALRRPYDPSGGSAEPRTSPVPLAIVVGALVFALLYPFVDQSYSTNYQFDTHIFASHVGQFLQALYTGNPGLLPKLSYWPPYFDAYDVLLTTLTAASMGFARAFPGLLPALPAAAELSNVEILTNFWARWMSLGFHCAGMAFLWLALMRLYARPLVALGLTLLVALAPTLIDIDLGRNDWGVLGSLCAVLYFNVRMAQDDQRTGVLIGLGAAAALLVTMKLNGPSFAVFVATGFLAIAVHRGPDVRRMGALLLAFALPLVFLSVRQIYYFDQFVPNLVAQLDELRHWSAGAPKPSLFYYSWDLLESQGIVYRWLVWGSVPVVIVLLLARATLTSAFVFGAFGAFVGASLLVDYGFARGGYHLLPLFVLMIATALAGLERALRGILRRPALAGVLASAAVAMLLAEPLLAVGRNYAAQAALMYGRPSAVHATRTLPAQWMAAAFPRGTRVSTLLGSEAPFVPPIHKLGFAFDETFVPRAGAVEPFRSFEPPSLEALRASSDVLIMTDWQLNWLGWRLVSLGRQDAAERLQRWLETMRRDVPSVAFSAPGPGYYYRSVEIFALDPATSAAALRATLKSIPTAVEVRGP